MYNSESSLATNSFEESIIDYEVREFKTEIDLDDDRISIENDNIPDEGTICNSKSVWWEGPTSLLLSMYNELAPKIGKSVELKTKKKMWYVIKEKMQQQGYAFTVTQIQQKHFTLKRKSNKVKMINENKEEAGNDRLNGLIQQNEVLHNKDETYAKFVLRENEISMNYTSIEENDSMTVDDPIAADTKCESKDGSSLFSETYLEQKKTTSAILIEMEKNNEKFREKLLKILEENNRRRRERDKNREKYEVEKNTIRRKKLELLEKLINKKKC